MKFNKSVIPNKCVLEGKIAKKNKSATLVFGTLEYNSITIAIVFQKWLSLFLKASF